MRSRREIAQQTSSAALARSVHPQDRVPRCKLQAGEGMHPALVPGVENK